VGGEVTRVEERNYILKDIESNMERFFEMALKAEERGQWLRMKELLRIALVYANQLAEFQERGVADE
jgi:hypothetical protein